MTELIIKLFVKDSKNTSDARVRERYGKFAGIVGIVTNFMLFAVKIAVGLIFSSISIIADAVNNLTDSGSSLITLIGFKISGKPADAKHPYGHARMEYITELIVSFMVMFLGFQLVTGSVEKIINQQQTVFSWPLVIVLLAAILIKLWQCLFFRKVGKIIKSDAILAASADSRNDILATLTVLAGIVVSNLTGYNLDGFMGAAVAVFIMVSGYKMISGTVSQLLGTAPSKELVDAIYRKILSYDGIVGLHDLTVHNYGVSQYFASVHCEVPANQDFMLSHDIIDNIEKDILKDMGINLVIHLDPVVTDDERTNELKARVKELIARISPQINMHDFRVVWGVTHSNLIFDVVTPFEFELSDEQVVERISGEIRKLNPSYRAFITVDHNYVPDFAC